MTTVKLMGALPGGDNNGASAIGGELVADPKRLHPMIVIVDCRRVAIDQDSGEQTATVRVRRIEALLPEDLASAERLLRRALEFRTGKTVLPLDLEDEINAAFQQLDFDSLADGPDQAAGGADEPQEGGCEGEEQDDEPEPPQDGDE